MNQLLYNYDIYPKVFPVGKPVDITIRGLGEHALFSGGYKVAVLRLDAGLDAEYDVTAGADNTLRITYTAPAECEYFLRVFRAGEDRKLFQLSVYALDPDLACRIPLRGDLHMHTCRSDGHEDPATVCANYRKIGYDFLVITDHHRYYPSLEARKAYEDAPHFLNILPGEEVHLPMTSVHIVNAGGTFSVNGMLDTSDNFREKGAALETRSLDGKAPDVLTPEEYTRQIEAVEASEALADCPDNVEKRSYAVCCWAFDRIREGGGLAIFAHPYWINNVWHVAEPFTRYMMKKHPFDAFEVLGGENYYEQNGFQTTTMNTVRTVCMPSSVRPIPTAPPNTTATPTSARRSSLPMKTSARISSRPSVINIRSPWTPSPKNTVWSASSASRNTPAS